MQTGGYSDTERGRKVAFLKNEKSLSKVLRISVSSMLGHR